MRIFIDCTHTFHGQINTGIQRVVRNVVNFAPSVGQQLGIECVPVVLGETGYSRISKLSSCFETSTKFHLMEHLNNSYLKIIRVIVKHSPFPKFNQFLTAAKHEFGLTRIIRLMLSPFLGLKNPNQVTYESAMENLIEPTHGDILLLPDVVWAYKFQDAANQAKKQGAMVISIIYDIIPISHPETQDANNVINFQACLPKLYACADGFMGISDFTKITLMKHFKDQPYATDFATKHFDFFHLGAELDAIDHKDNIRDIIKKPFDSNVSVYLIVGTIEPRKNHLYLLDVFNLLWGTGVQATLVIVGKVGWLCDSIIDTIYSHPMYGIRLFVFSDASDTELDYCYSHAKALLFPAIIEGFGLPIIEAQKKGLPVFASDIPVFREVAKDTAAYFDNTAPQALADLLLEYERTGVFPATGPSGFTWPSWEECTHQMLTRLIKMYQEIQSEQSQAQAHNKTSC